MGEELWFALEATLLDRKAPKNWNPAVFFPIGLAQYALLDHRKDLFADLLDVSLVGSYLSTLLPWNLTKGVYLFDPDLFEELVEAPLDRIPTDLLTRLPEAAPLLVFPRPWRGLVAAWAAWTRTGARNPTSSSAPSSCRRRTRCSCPCRWTSRPLPLRSASPIPRRKARL